MEVGRAFGEMALLYNCNRTASVKALTNSKFWTLDRRVYQQIMMNSSVHKHKENFQFLLSVSDFKNLSQRKLHKLADVLELIYYPGNDYIIRQGEVGETFFIIHSGQVKVTQSKAPGEPPQDIRILEAGDWFGERALYTREKRSANVVAMPPGVHVLCLDRSQSPATDGEDYFGSVEKRASMTSQASLEDGTPGISVSISSSRSGSGMGALSPFFPTVAPVPAGKRSAEMAGVDADTVVGNARAIAGRNAIKYEDLVPVAILGIGGFGRVELITISMGILEHL
ncbi:unnamed protein product [Rodentolepis nana]|uniref:Cyclic nucleotide-binding domain-containing protein n=1 Tax=Rodentolepis nana TaxID=102285 RepID=A0A158QIK1_RODNA|nr:unnamed protein product [Rodentolepis nana]